MYPDLDYFIACEENVRIFTHHRNLLFIFQPSRIEPYLARHAVLTVIRWTLYLSTFWYIIEHVDRDLKCFADKLTRLLRVYRSRKSSVRQVQKVIPFYDIPMSALSGNFDWRSADITKTNNTKLHIRCLSPQAIIPTVSFFCTKRYRYLVTITIQNFAFSVLPIPGRLDTVE